MRRSTLHGLVVILVMAAVAPASAASVPAWAFPPCPATPSGSADSAGDRALQVPGSKQHFTTADIRNWSQIADWFPEEHPPLPAILSASHSPTTAACAYCHLPDGSGRPENAKLSALPAAYIIAQVAAFHSTARRPAQPGWKPSLFMRDFTIAYSAEEIAGAADYYSHRPARSFMRLVETDRVPAHTSACFIFMHSPGPEVSLNSQLLEMPTDPARFEARDPHTPYVGYVPPGSIERGRRTAMTGDHGHVQPCAACHGPDLKGGPGSVGPPLAGQFPGYLLRQLYAFKSGTRQGAAAQPMQAVVARMGQRTLLDLAAYAASLPP